MTIREASRNMLNEAKIPNGYWRESIYTIVYVQNRGHLRVNGDNSPYELWFRRPNSTNYLEFLEVIST